MYKPTKCLKGITVEDCRKTIGKPWDNCGKPVENNRKIMGKAWDSFGKL